jgi:hypothetical protein
MAALDIRRRLIKQPSKLDAGEEPALLHLPRATRAAAGQHDAFERAGRKLASRVLPDAVVTRPRIAIKPPQGVGVKRRGTTLLPRLRIALELDRPSLQQVAADCLH